MLSFLTLFDPFNYSIYDSALKTNVEKSEHEVKVQLTVPGIPKEDLSVNVQQNKLYVTYQPSENRTKSWLDHHLSNFERIWIMDDSLDPESVKAKCQDGILEVTINKKQSAYPKHIQIE